MELFSKSQRFNKIKGNIDGIVLKKGKNGVFPQMVLGKKALNMRFKYKIITQKSKSLLHSYNDNLCSSI